MSTTTLDCGCSFPGDDRCEVFRELQQTKDRAYQNLLDAEDDVKEARSRYDRQEARQEAARARERYDRAREAYKEHRTAPRKQTAQPGRDPD